MRTRVRAWWCVLLTVSTLRAEPIVIPNFSFEDPPVTRDGPNPFGALPYIAEWDETNVGFADELDQDTGNFINTDLGQPDRIVNLHLLRAAFVSSLIRNTVRQELSETFVVGRRYTFTLSVGKSFTFPVGATEQLEIAFFYFDRGAERIIASTFVNGASVGTTTMTDFSVATSFVQPSDAWAGRPIGILARPAINDPDDDDGEGFWNLDHARLDEASPPSSDADDDGDVDLLDAAEFQVCFAGQGASGACSTFDLNSDSAIDLDDAGLFLDDLEGPISD